MKGKTIIFSLWALVAALTTAGQTRTISARVISESDSIPVECDSVLYHEDSKELSEVVVRGSKKYIILPKNRTGLNDKKTT